MKNNQQSYWDSISVPLAQERDTLPVTPQRAEPQAWICLGGSSGRQGLPDERFTEFLRS